VDYVNGHDDRESLYKPITVKMVLRLCSLLKPYWKGYLAVATLGLAVAGLEAIPPKIVGQVIDRLSTGGMLIRMILVYGGIWLAIIGTVQIMHSLQISFANRAGEKVLSDLRFKMFEHLQSLSIAYFDKNHVGRIVARMGNDIDTLRNILVWGVNTVVANATIMLLAGAMVAGSDIALFFSIAWLVPILLVLHYFYARHVGEAWQKVRVHSTKVAAAQAESISGVKVIAAYNRQKRNSDYFRGLQVTNTENNVWASGISGKFQALILGIRFIGQAILILYGGYRVVHGALRPGELVAVMLYWESFMIPVSSFGAFFNNMLLSMASAERVFALLDEKPQVNDRQGARKVSDVRGRITFEHVSFGYHPGHKAVKDVSFDVVPGTMVGLVGATGSGKSTVISLISRFYDHLDGRIAIDGRDVRSITRESLRHFMAVVPQSNFLFTGTVMDNLKYAKPEATDDEVYDAAKCLECHELIAALNDGYQTIVGEKGASLSFGQRQLVCLTRAMVADPKILLLDEATSAVDPYTEEMIQRALRRLVSNRTTFVVAHRLGTVVSAEQILLMDTGRIIERGTHSELMSRRGRYAALVESGAGCACFD
jgi:ATP-binding cassette subfamily B multidrug efflux pump